MNKYGAAAIATGLTTWMLQRFDDWSEQNFPAKKAPVLAAQPGYKIFGYMGCPSDKVEAIRKKQRFLFFADTVDIPQTYALSRTSWWSQLRGENQPVVVQLEIREDADINEEDMWNDPKLSQQTVSILPQFISCWPAIPPNIQEKCDLQVRVHHVVTCNVQQLGGGKCRAIQALMQRVKDQITSEKK